MSKTITSQRAIAKAIASLDTGARIEVKFAPITDPVWIGEEESGRKCVMDSGGNGLYAMLMSDIIVGKSQTCTVIARHEDGDLRLEVHNNANDDVWINAAYLVSLRVLPSPTTHIVDGMTKDIVLHPEGHAVVGCQTITRKGLQQIHDLLTKHLAATAASG